MVGDGVDTTDGLLRSHQHGLDDVDSGGGIFQQLLRISLDVRPDIEDRTMNIWDWILLAITSGLLVYLLIALLMAEKF